MRTPCYQAGWQPTHVNAGITVSAMRACAVSAGDGEISEIGADIVLDTYLY